MSSSENQAAGQGGLCQAEQNKFCPAVWWAAAFVIFTVITSILIGRFLLTPEIYERNRIWGHNVHVFVGNNLATGGALFQEYNCEASPEKMVYKAIRPAVPTALAALILKSGLISIGDLPRFVVLQGFFWIALGLIIFLLFSDVFGSLWGAFLAAGWIWYFPGMFDVFTQHSVEPFYMFFLYLFLLAAVRARRAASRRKMIILSSLSGLLFGLTILCKPVLLYLLFGLSAFALPGYLLIRTKPVAVKSAAGILSFIVCAWLAIMPWAVRNYFAFGGRVVFGTTNSGINLYMGAVAEEDNEETRAFFRNLMCRVDALSSPDEIERSKELKAMAWQTISADPVSYIKRKSSHFLKETLMPSLSGEYCDVQGPPRIGETAAYVQARFLAPFIPLVPAWMEWAAALLFFAGVIRTVRKNNYEAILLLAIFVFCNAMSSLAQYRLRYFLPYLPIYIMFSIYGLQELRHYTTSRYERLIALRRR